MAKKKIDFKKYADMHEETELTGKDGTKVKVRDHISYENKIEMCREILENCIMIHDDSCCYENVNINAERIKAIMKYYTDVPVDDVQATEVCDFVINNELIGAIRDYIYHDYIEAEDVYITMLNMVMDTTNDDMSLKKAVKKSFGSILTGEDITETFAKAEATSNVLFDALGALRKQEKQKEENIDHGKLSVGGNVINFAKKTE